MISAMYEKSEACNYLTRQQAIAEFNLSASTIERVSQACGAKLKIGRSARYRKDKLREYIDGLQK